MPEPTPKAVHIDEFLKGLGMDRHKIYENCCSLCGMPATDFKDEISRREYTISGACQPCQEVVFAPPDDE